ncbi:hypothetical protein JZ751_026677 [Albula glossodonta]|uniref:Guanine nucleotide-binding protein subunit alpha-13 n=1 Tax=Albula glossodonta TaxID=121402 RepID=A0A8T2PAB3_9TELE|nr:hypothetical protein JZ751_026677 [Albula glossodonta]
MLSLRSTSCADVSELSAEEETGHITHAASTFCICSYVAEGKGGSGLGVCCCWETLQGGFLLRPGLGVADISRTVQFVIFAPPPQPTRPDSAAVARKDQSTFQPLPLGFKELNPGRGGGREYLPSQQDILLARRPTKGIHEYDFEIKNVPFKMVDVGGQRSERRRWFECFDSVTSILFLVSSSEFDQVLMEDRQTNRLMESLNIFETIVNNRVFSNVSIILFLNKTDLLEEKVKSVAIKDYFPEYEGEPHNLADVQKFLVECFRNKRRDQQQKPLYHHFTTAINTENIRLVFRDVKDTILHDNLKQLMLQ